MAAADWRIQSLNTAARVSAGRRACELAECSLAQNWIADALRYDQEALHLGVDSEAGAFRRWACYMMLGDFERAWEETDRSEARRLALSIQTLDLPLHERRVWDGSPFDRRRVMVRCYHGLGDTIQFARFLPVLGQTANSVTVQAQSSLIKLLASIPEIDKIVSIDGGETDGAFDVEVELMELPYAFRTTLRTLPCAGAYLKVPPELVADRGEQLRRAGMCADRCNIGMVWSSGNWNPERSLDFGTLQPLSKVPGVRLFSLQRGAAMEQLERSASGFEIIPTEHEGGTPLDTAAAIVNLDLIISVDTMVAHLAGALGKPVWTLLPFRADWRWMIDREDSPWYPTMRLFRQPHPGAWETVVERVASELGQLARG